MVAKANTPSEVQAMCTVRDRQGIWQRLSQDAIGSRWQMFSVQTREPNDGSKPAAATDQHDFHECRSEVCWQMRQQARRKALLPMRVGGRVKMVVFVAHIRANGLSLETDRWGRTRGEGRGLDNSQRVRDHFVEIDRALKAKLNTSSTHCQQPK